MVFFHFSSVSSHEVVTPLFSSLRRIISSPINLSRTFMSIYSLGSSSVSIAQPHIRESVSILSRNAIESSRSFSVIVTKASGFSPSSTALFLRRSSRWALNRSMADDTSLIGLEESGSLLVVSLGGVFTTSQIGSFDSGCLLVSGPSITGSGDSKLLEVPDVEGIGTSACSAT